MINEHFLFRGCLIPSRLPYLERSSRFVLDKMDVRYDDLPGETCCVEPIGLRSLALDTWLVSAARILSIAEENGRDIISLCNGCYMSLKEAEHALKDEATRENVNTVLRSIGREYGGNVSVRHIGASSGSRARTKFVHSSPHQCRSSNWPPIQDVIWSDLREYWGWFIIFDPRSSPS